MVCAKQQQQQQPMAEVVDALPEPPWALWLVVVVVGPRAAAVELLLLLAPALGPRLVSQTGWRTGKLPGRAVILAAQHLHQRLLY